MGQPNNRYRSYSFQATKQKKQIGSVWDFLNLQLYFAEGALTPISKSTFLCSTSLCSPSFSKNISIFGSGSKNNKWRLSVPPKSFYEPQGYLKILWMRLNCLKATEPLSGDTLLFTSKSPGVNGTCLIYLRRMKDQCILSYSYKPFRPLSLSRNFSQFSFKAIYVTTVGVNLEIYS